MPPLTDEARERLAKAFPRLSGSGALLDDGGDFRAAVQQETQHKATLAKGFDANDLPF